MAFEGPTGPSSTEDAVGWRLSVYWPEYDEWYIGVVHRVIDEDKVRVHYQDGDKKSVNLRKADVKWIERVGKNAAKVQSVLNALPADHIAVQAAAALASRGMDAPVALKNVLVAEGELEDSGLLEIPSSDEDATEDEAEDEDEEDEEDDDEDDATSSSDDDDDDETSSGEDDDGSEDDDEDDDSDADATDDGETSSDGDELEVSTSSAAASPSKKKKKKSTKSKAKRSKKKKKKKDSSKKKGRRSRSRSRSRSRGRGRGGDDDVDDGDLGGSRGRSRSRARTPDEVTVKFQFGSDIIRETYSFDKNYFEMVRELSEHFGESFTLKYRDAEKDLITIKAQDHLTAAFEHYQTHILPAASEGERPSLRISVEPGSSLATPTGTYYSVARPYTSGTPIAMRGRPSTQGGAPVDRRLSGIAFNASTGSSGSATPSGLMPVLEDFPDGAPRIPPKPFRRSVSEDMFGGTYSSTGRPGTAMSAAGTDAIIRAGGIDHWKRGQLLGSGSFGKVYAALDLNSGTQIAVKQVRFPKDSRKKAREVDALQREVELLSDLDHPNIVKYIGTTRDASKLYIFLEFASGGSVTSALNRYGAFSEAVIRRYTAQTLEGLAYLHHNGIVHRDIKGSNLLIDHGIIKLADFGCSKRVAACGSQNPSEHQNTAVGTTQFMAPEIMKEEGTYGRKADIWSLGMTVLEMATGKPPWSNVSHAVYKIVATEETPPIPDTLSPEAHDFLDLCFRRNPEERPDAADLLVHPFLDEPEGADMFKNPKHHSKYKGGSSSSGGGGGGGKETKESKFAESDGPGPVGVGAPPLAPAPAGHIALASALSADAAATASRRRPSAPSTAVSSVSMADSRLDSRSSLGSGTSGSASGAEGRSGVPSDSLSFSTSVDGDLAAAAVEAAGFENKVRRVTTVTPDPDDDSSDSGSSFEGHAGEDVRADLDESRSGLLDGFVTLPEPQTATWMKEEIDRAKAEGALGLSGLRDDPRDDTDEDGRGSASLPPSASSSPHFGDDQFGMK